MVARDPSKPKAAHLKDLDVLNAIYEASAHGTWPGDYLLLPDGSPVPGKLLVAKIRKLQQQGKVAVSQSTYVLTQAGREALLG